MTHSMQSIFERVCDLVRKTCIDWFGGLVNQPGHTNSCDALWSRREAGPTHCKAVAGRFVRSGWCRTKPSTKGPTGCEADGVRSAGKSSDWLAVSLGGGTAVQANALG